MEENSGLTNENRKLKEALRTALEYEQKRGQHLRILQETNDFYRANHEEMDKRYTSIVDELSGENERIKTKLREMVSENTELKTTNALLYQKMNQDNETEKMFAEFDKKYKVIVEENVKCIEQYKSLNEKLKKQNDSLRKQNTTIRSKSEKSKDEMKTIKKTNQKLDKKVSTLTNLCRDLQSRLKQEQERVKSLEEQTENAI